MRLKPEQLAEHLRKPLLPVYLVTGDEPLQAGEAADTIRAAARAAGFAQREVIEAGPGFDWNGLAAEAASFSLFAEKKLIDLRLPSGKPGREGGKALADYCADPPPDTLLLLSLPKLDRQQQSAKWFKAIDQRGAVVQVWPIGPRELPRWIEQRLRAAGLEPSREAVRLLADRVEGNLLAARQEIDKLLLLHGTGPLDAEALIEAVADSARYDVFELVDTALRGEAARALHILEGLRGEGTAPAVVLWALHREIAQLAKLAVASARGVGIDHALARNKVWERRKPLLRQAVARLRPAQWLALLDECHRADCSVKQADPLDPWLRLENLALGIAGT